jgi:hypothetical protein
MQIYELNSNNDVLVLEGLWDTVRDTVKAAVSKDPKLSNLSFDQKLSMLAKDTRIDQIAKRALDTWTAFAARRAQQDPAFLNPQTYAKELKLFVQKNLLPAYTNYDLLTVKTQLDQQLREIVRNRRDFRLQAPAFNKLVDFAAVAQVDPAAVTRGTAPGVQRNQQQRKKQKGATGSQPAAFTVADVGNIFGSINVNDVNLKRLGSMLQQAANTNTVSKTNNPAIDTVLQVLGFTLT